MLYPIQFIIDVLFPPSVHGFTLRHVTKKRFACWYRPQDSEGVICLSPYTLPEVQAAITACKFEHNYQAAKLLSILIEEYLRTLPVKQTLIIPVPLSAKRQRQRQFNQVERVLHCIKNLPSHYRICNSLVLRALHTQPQTSLNRAERLKNIHGAFTLHKKNMYHLENIERVILCDDVMTTGATLREVKTVLAQHLSKNVEIICVAWAH